MAARPTTTTTTGSTTEHVGGGGPGTANPAGYYWDAPLHWVGGHVQARGVLVPVPAFLLPRDLRSGSERIVTWHDGAIVNTGITGAGRAAPAPAAKQASQP